MYFDGGVRPWAVYIDELCYIWVIVVHNVFFYKAARSTYRIPQDTSKKKSLIVCKTQNLIKLATK